MGRVILSTAAATGAFCAVFAAGVDLATDALALWQVMIAGAASGFLGSMFGQMAIRRREERR